MSIVKGTAADISPYLLDKLEKTFPEIQTRWKPGDNLEDLAYRTGQREVIDWIRTHAKLSSTGA